jgi:tripartite-type tricarboxylate transporter receptor subunit TctC
MGESMGRAWSALQAACSGAICLLFFVVPAMAQTWPERAVKIVVPYPAGGNVDSAARAVADKLQLALGQSVVIENKAGAGGLLGCEAVAKATPDGYTLLVSTSGPVLFAPETASRRAYEWRRDLSPITMISTTPIVLQVHPSVKARTVRELFDLAKSEPGKLTMASPGSATANYFLSEALQERFNLKWVTVQYKGNAPATNDLIAGHVQFSFDQLSVALPYIQAGQTRAIAVVAEKRSSWLPDVPSFAEAGIPDTDASTFTGLFAPAGTPPAIIEKLNAEMTKILADPEVKKRFAALSADTFPMSPQALRAALEKEEAAWLPIIRKLNVKQ